ncbi:MAG: copper transporter [Bacillota bacterium]
MFDVRYHISSLMAVFLALGIGILIGSTLIGDDLLINEQRQMIDRLEQDFVSLRKQARIAQEELAVTRQMVGLYEQFAQEVFPILAQGRLEGRNLAIIKTGKCGDLEPLLANLKWTGARIESVTTIKSDLNLKEIATLMPSPDLIAGVHSASQVPAHLATIIGKVIHQGQGMEIMQFLQNIDLVETSGNYGKNVDAVILIGGSALEKDNYFRALDLPLINYFKEQKVRVIGTEFSNAGVSYIKLYQSQSLTTVDNVDTVLGITALVMALAGGEGNFGIKPTAERLLPVAVQ